MMRWLYVARTGVRSLFARRGSMSSSMPICSFTSSRRRPSTSVKGCPPTMLDARR